MASLAGAAEPGHFEAVGNRSIYVNYQPAREGRPTLVLLNGLTYSTSDWDAFVAAVGKLDAGLGILRFDMIGMGQTLLQNQLPVDYDIAYQDQVELTAALMRQLGLARGYILGLSYGGGIAVAFGVRHPEMVDQLILMAPFTEPLSTMDQYIRNEVAGNRLAVPLNPATDDELYDYFLRNFVYSAYPSLEPSVLDNPYKLEGIFRMVQGIRKYETLADVARGPVVPTHLIVANQDQYIPKDVHDRFWNALPAASRRSRIDISQTEHKIPQAVPDFAAAWVLAILSGRPELERGLAFQGSTDSFDARAGSVVIPLR